jgi:fluoride exporter
MREITLVAIGGAAGSVCRYLTQYTVDLLAGDPDIFTGIFFENILGCFLIGVLYAGSVKNNWLTPELRLLILIGFIGSYTTYSGFGTEAISLFQKSIIDGLFYMLLQIVTGILAVWTGIALIFRLDK